ncbi:S-adenosylmethionine sensor upstream of mTORC1 [Diabrotica undecimpunctata]|uniref:S-adenosylmethionine sensor upstream of mTORC1 n=1 Tax=Diabrotica undecimpunctata TaxID=50387 RepID=UPI003B63B9DA
MVLKEHIELANFVKNVHEELREKSKLIGVEAAWNQHCQNTEKLKQYAAAMKELATNHWQNSSKDGENISRISWVYRACLDYFNKDVLVLRNKEMDIMKKLNVNVCNSFQTIAKNRWNLLDVGSCYNPFQVFEEFLVTAVDIAPALNSVFKCDFINVKADQKLNSENNEITVLPKDYFDIIVFSLFLEYLPSPPQRKLCCEKAYELLTPEGILIIITPDSNHVGSNAKYIKSWRFVLANMGFSRIKYEKLKHIHCMVFRKVPVKGITQRWAEIHKAEQAFDEIYIPQDFKKKPQQSESFNNVKELTVEDIVTLSNELPFCDTFD